MGLITGKARLVLGEPDNGLAGPRRALRGLRERDRAELILGLALTALSWLRSTKPRRELLYRRRVPVGSAIVIHHKRLGSPRIEVVKPKKRR